MTNDAFEEMFNNYFGVKDFKEQIKDLPQELTKDVEETHRLTANGNISTINEFGELLRKLLNAAFGDGWGEFTQDGSIGTDPKSIKLPMITYDTNLREVAEGKSQKPTLTDTIDEVINGIHTGDSIRVYRQMFDCIVEFDFFASTTFECEKLMTDFENLIIDFSGYLKLNGISEIFFLKEVPSKYSFRFTETLPMRSLFYFVRIEKIRTSRISEIKMIEKRLNIKDELSH